MEAYLEAIDVGCLRAATEGLPEVKDPANPLVTRRSTTGGMQRQEMHSTGTLVRISSIMYVMQKILMNCEKTFVLSMRKLRVRVRNATILL
jgi:hypothetical protein